MGRKLDQIDNRNDTMRRDAEVTGMRSKFTSEYAATVRAIETCIVTRDFMTIARDTRMNTKPPLASRGNCPTRYGVPYGTTNLFARVVLAYRRHPKQMELNYLSEIRDVYISLTTTFIGSLIETLGTCATYRNCVILYSNRARYCSI